MKGCVFFRNRKNSVISSLRPLTISFPCCILDILRRNRPPQSNIIHSLGERIAEIEPSVFSGSNPHYLNRIIPA